MEVAREAPVYVIGAVNMDISGTPDGELRTGNSNPGQVIVSPGGVGRNIAENLCRLGRKVSLITVLGNDDYAEMIRAQCRNLGIDLSCSLTDPHGRTSTYLCLNDRNGELHAAISDMKIYDQLTPERLEPLLPEINSGSMLIADANIPERTLEWIAANVTIPIAADPVSVAKAPRLRPLLHRLVFLKPTMQEAKALAGMASDTPATLSYITDTLHGLGVARVYLSLGAEGVWADDGREGVLLPIINGTVINTTGCGDAFAAAAADAYLRGMGTADCARRGLSAAAICAEDPAAVSQEMSQEAVELRLIYFD